MISYRQLLDVFWEANGGSEHYYSRQYLSIIFYHNDEQRRMAVESYEQQRTLHRNTVSTEIVPFTEFYLAEDYHQKYYLQQDSRLIRGIENSFESFDAFVNSTETARLNGYTGGYGDMETLERDINSYGLNPKGKERLREITQRGLKPGCKLPELT